MWSGPCSKECGGVKKIDGKNIILKIKKDKSENLKREIKHLKFYNTMGSETFHFLC